MLSKAVARSASKSIWIRWMWLRRMTIVLMLIATPGPADVVLDVVAFATGVECCDGYCEDDSGRCCPKSCSHCRCCAHLSAVIPTEPVLPSSFAGYEPTYGIHAALLYPIDYRAPPYRPPVSAFASNASA